ncbi:MAG: energy transducer TonB [Candidatus Kapaibacterium sp.]
MCCFLLHAGATDGAEIARRNGIEGMAEVRVLIDKHGKVSEIRDDAGGNLMLNEAVRDAIRRTAFTPAIRHSSSVDMWIVIPVLFSLSNQTPVAAGGGE